jgi:hypothetical protein
MGHAMIGKLPAARYLRVLPCGGLCTGHSPSSPSRPSPLFVSSSVGLTVTLLGLVRRVTVSDRPGQVALLSWPPPGRLIIPDPRWCLPWRYTDDLGGPGACAACLGEAAPLAAIRACREEARRGGRSSRDIYRTALMAIFKRCCAGRIGGDADCGGLPGWTGRSDARRPFAAMFPVWGNQRCDGLVFPETTLNRHEQASSTPLPQLVLRYRGLPQTPTSPSTAGVSSNLLSPRLSGRFFQVLHTTFLNILSLWA